jgi:hypothetical protein
MLAGSVSILLSVLGLGAALVGTSTAAAPIAVLGAVAYAATTLAPAASALVIDLGAAELGDGPDGSISPAVWEAVEPAIQYVFVQSLDKAAGDLTAMAIEPASTQGAAIFSVLNNAVGTTAGIAEQVGNVIFGTQCPSGVGVISFNPNTQACAGQDAGPAASCLPVGGIPTDCGMTPGSGSDTQCCSTECAVSSLPDGGVSATCRCATTEGVPCVNDSDCCDPNEQAKCVQGICCVPSGVEFVGECTSGLGPCCSAFNGGSGCENGPINGTCE